jgi:hypothetical protein
MSILIMAQFLKTGLMILRIYYYLIGWIIWSAQQAWKIRLIEKYIVLHVQ